MSLFIRQLRFELLKLFARKRTYLGFLFFLIVEVLILLGMGMPRHRHMIERQLTVQGLDYTNYYSGLTVAYQMIAWSIFTLGSVYLALVCGDIVAKEVEDGTMRMILSRPVSRLRILVLKYCACVCYTVTLALFVVGSSLVTGILVHGYGRLIVMAPWEQIFAYYEPVPGLERFALAGAALTFCLLTLSTLAFMFSCFNLKPATATILTLSVYLIDDILRNVPFFADLRNYFLSHHMNVWSHLFENVIPWPRIFQSLGYLALFDVIALTIAGVYFLRRDFKS
jgi:ABC-2 type transport system permease protein